MGDAGTREIVDLVDFQIERESDVVPDDLEIRIADNVRDVLLAPGIEIVDANDVAAVGQEPFAQVRAEKSGPAGDQHALLVGHALPRPSLRETTRRNIHAAVRFPEKCAEQRQLRPAGPAQIWRLQLWIGGRGRNSNLRRRKPADLQSAPFATRDTLPRRKPCAVSDERQTAPLVGICAFYGQPPGRSQWRPAGIAGPFAAFAKPPAPWEEPRQMQVGAN